MTAAPISAGAHVADDTRHDRILRRLRRFLTTERLNSVRFLLLFWFLTRLAVFLTWGIFTPSTQGDVIYYYNGIQRMFLVGPEQTMQEYPTPVLWMLTLPWITGLGTATGYVISFVLFMLALDAAFTITLWRSGGAMRGQAVVFWSLYMGFVGPTGFLRFDLVTSILAGWALLWVMRHLTGVAGALSGVGAAIKLWPAMLWPALLGGSRRGKIWASVGFFGAGGLLALASLLWAGWDRLLSPLGWQSGRGLQVESIWATIPMALRGFGIGDYAVAISRFQAFEIWGTGVSVMMTASDIAFIVGLLAAVLAYAVWIWRGRGRLIEAVALMLFVILLMIVTNKTFSPQYIVWLGGPGAVALAILGQREPFTPIYSSDRRRIKRASILLLWITLLTTIVYPLGYGPLVRDLYGWAFYLRIPTTLILVARNVLVVWLFCGIVAWLWSFLRPDIVKRVRAEVKAFA